MDWLVTGQGECQAIATSPISDSNQPYRLYRFLTDVEDLLTDSKGDRSLLIDLMPLVRKLLNSSIWMSLADLEPDPELGWAVQVLYDAPDFPLTVQLVSWLPDRVSPIHNHGTWGIVAILAGLEKNHFWTRTGDRRFPDKLKSTGDLTLEAGETIGFTGNAIHSIEALEPTISFNMYGETKYDQRFEFNLASSTAQLF
jgi:predicted metal-dependent enzyme (double-stranded beta helix superfamily)